MEIKIQSYPKFEIVLEDGVKEELEERAKELFFDSDQDYMEAFTKRGFELKFCLENRADTRKGEMQYLPKIEISRDSSNKGAARQQARSAYLYPWLSTRFEGGQVIVSMRSRPRLSLEQEK